MPRTLSPNTQTAIQQPITEPAYLMQLGFSTPLRLTTRANTVTWNSQSWFPQGFGRRPVRLSDNIDGVQSGVMQLTNHDNSLGALLLGEGCAEKSCDIWIIYGSGSLALADATHVFCGVMDEATQIAYRSVTITMFSQNADDKFTPHIKITRPTFNHPSVNTRISWNGQVYELRRDDD